MTNPQLDLFGAVLRAYTDAPGGELANADLYRAAAGHAGVDPGGGTGTTGLAAERLGRRWIVVEQTAEYLRAGGELFRGSAGFTLNPELEAA